MRALPIIVLLLLASCAPVKLDPFGRPYDARNALPAGPLRGCGPASAFDSPPVLISGTRPLYPVGELLKQREAIARVRISVATNGTIGVADPNPEEGAQWFLRHAIIAVRDWEVRPAMKADQPVEVTCHVSFVYRLE